MLFTHFQAHREVSALSTSYKCKPVPDLSSGRGEISLWPPRQALRSRGEESTFSLASSQTMWGLGGDSVGLVMCVYTLCPQIEKTGVREDGASPSLRSPLLVSLSDTELITPAGTHTVSEACRCGVTKTVTVFRCFLLFAKSGNPTPMPDCLALNLRPPLISCMTLGSLLCALTHLQHEDSTTDFGRLLGGLSDLKNARHLEP